MSDSVRGKSGNDVRQVLREFPERLNALYTKKYYDAGLPELPRASDFRQWESFLESPRRSLEKLKQIRWRPTHFESVGENEVLESLAPIVGKLDEAKVVRVAALFGAIRSEPFEDLMAEFRYLHVSRVLEAWSTASGREPDFAKVEPELEWLGFPPGKLEEGVADIRRWQKKVARAEQEEERKESLDDDAGDELDRQFRKLDPKVQRRGLRSLEPDERLVHALYLLDAEVVNGGLWQYLFNTGGRFLPETVDALRTVGARGLASKLERISAKLRSMKPAQVRRAIGDSPTPEQERFDEAYYAATKPPLALLWRYLQKRAR